MSEESGSTKGDPGLIGRSWFIMPMHHRALIEDPEGKTYCN